MKYLLILVEIFFLKNAYSQDSLRSESKNAFYFYAAPTLNNMTDTKEFEKYGVIEPKGSWSNQFGYARNLTQRFSTSLNFVIENQKLSHKNAVVTVSVNPFYDPRQNYFPPSYNYEMIADINYMYKYFSINSSSFYSIIKNKRVEINYWFGANYILLDNLNYTGMPEPLPVAGTTTGQGLKTPFIYTKNTRFKLLTGFGVNVNLTKKFVLSILPGYQIFLAKSIYNARFYDISCRVGLGYKW